MEREQLDHYWHPDIIDLDGTELRRFEESPTPAECLDHMRDGIRILPAFRILDKAFNSARELGFSVSHAYLDIDTVLPEDVPYLTVKHPLNPLSHTGKIELVRKDGVNSVEFDLINLQTNELPERIAVSPIKNVSTEDVLIDHQGIAAIIPQGPSIHFVDGVLKPEAHTQQQSLIEGFHLVKEREFALVTNHNKKGPSDRRPKFELAPTLEGFSQLAYVHFQRAINPKDPMTPFFKDVSCEFNTTYQPKLNEPIYYVLDKFETDFVERGDKGEGIISGKVIAGDRNTVIAEYYARVGALRQKLFDYTVAKIVKRAQKEAEEKAGTLSIATAKKELAEAYVSAESSNTP